MNKTIVGTHADKNPLWQAWSEAVAFAESRIGEYNENAAWAKVDKLWNEYTMSREVEKAYYLYKICRKDLGKAISKIQSDLCHTLRPEPFASIGTQPGNVISLPSDDYKGAGW